MVTEYLDLVNQNRSELRRWLPWVDSVKSKEDALAFIQRTRKQWVNDEGFTAGILYKGQLSGIAGFNSLNRKQKHVAIGYWLGTSYQGKGIMTKVCSHLVQYAFTAMGMNRIEIRTAVHNPKSRSIPERLGFTQEGIARQSAWVNERCIDYVVYSLLAEEWNGGSVQP